MHRQGSGQSLLREQIHRSQRFERKTASFGQKTVLPCFPCAGRELGGKIHSWRTCHTQKIQRQMIARNFCPLFVDTQRFNVKFVGNFYIRYKKNVSNCCRTANKKQDLFTGLVFCFTTCCRHVRKMPQKEESSFLFCRGR